MYIYMYDERQANASSMQNFIILFFFKSDKDLFLFLIISNKVLRQTLEHDIAKLQLLWRWRNFHDVIVIFLSVKPYQTDYKEI